MNAIPLGVLVRALDALKAAKARLDNGSGPDPYIEILKAKSELAWYVNRALDQVEIEVKS